MIDMHAHILPGVDDGPDTLEDAVEMIRLAMREGISHIIVTPHYKLPRYDNTKTLEAFNQLMEAIKSEPIGIEVSLGNELYLDETALTALTSQNCRTLAGSQYVLVELPVQRLYPFHEQLLYEIQMRDYKVILAHIERYDYFMDNLSYLEEMIHRGCYTQMNASSIVARGTSKKLFTIVDKGLVHLIATDCHCIKKRAPYFKKAYEQVEARVGAKMAERLFFSNGYNILNNQPLA